MKKNAYGLKTEAHLIKTTGQDALHKETLHTRHQKSIRAHSTAKVGCTATFNFCISPGRKKGLITFTKPHCTFSESAGREWRPATPPGQQRHVEGMTCTSGYGMVWFSDDMLS